MDALWILIAETWKKKERKKKATAMKKKAFVNAVKKTLKSAVKIIQSRDHVKIYVWLKFCIFPVDLHTRLQKKSSFGVA